MRPSSSPSSPSVYALEERERDWRRFQVKSAPIRSPGNSSPSSSSMHAIPLVTDALDDAIFQETFERHSEVYTFGTGSGHEGKMSVFSNRPDDFIELYPRSASPSSHYSEEDLSRTINVPSSECYRVSMSPGHNECEDDSMVNTRNSPDRNHDQEIDFMDPWSPPPLCSSSSSSSREQSFRLELFYESLDRSSGSLDTWNSGHASPVDSAVSPGCYSSSSFVEWATASIGNPKPTITLVEDTCLSSFASVTLHQPQPIRPIPPIPIDALSSSPGPDETRMVWTKDALKTRFPHFGLRMRFTEPGSPDLQRSEIIYDDSIDRVRQGNSPYEL